MGLGWGRSTLHLRNYDFWGLGHDSLILCNEWDELKNVFMYVEMMIRDVVETEKAYEVPPISEYRWPQCLFWLPWLCGGLAYSWRYKKKAAKNSYLPLCFPLFVLTSSRVCSKRSYRAYSGLEPLGSTVIVAQPFLFNSRLVSSNSRYNALRVWIDVVRSTLWHEH